MKKIYLLFFFCFISYFLMADDIEMIFVEGGTFQMGSNTNEDEQPIHEVKVSSFYLSKYEITQGFWKEMMETTPWVGKFKSYGYWYAAANISWYEAVKFCNKLSQKEGLDPVYQINQNIVTCDWESTGYRLPTEAEWEFAAGSGNKSVGQKYAGTSSEDELYRFARYNRSGRSEYPGDVETLSPNLLGLYHMSGNVRELCWDWYSTYTGDSQRDPHGPSSGDKRVVKGGSCQDLANHCRIAERYGIEPLKQFALNGFRVARSVQNTTN